MGLDIWFVDPDGDEAYESYYLEDAFPAGGAFGGFDGRAGTVDINASDLLDENEDPLDGIESLYIDLNLISTEGGTGEFALDNLSIDGGSGSAENSNVHPEFGGTGTNRLKGSFDAWIQFNVVNDGIDDTTFTATLDPSSHTAFVPGSPATNAPIGAGQTVTTGTVATLLADSPSGLYESFTLITNDLKPGDPDELYPYSVTIFDPPVLADNSGSPVDVKTAPDLSLGNAAAGPHAGAERAGVEVTARGVSGAGFEVSGLDMGEFVHPGETDLAAAAFDRFGRLSGSYAGTFTVDLEMNSAPGGFLNGDQPVPPVTWDLQYNLADIPNDTAAVALGEGFAQRLGVNSLTTAATLIDGTSSTSQTITLQDIGLPNPGSQTVVSGASTMVALSFETPSELHVLQIAYADINVPAGMSESDLRMLFFDPVADDWTWATSGNSDGGAGAAMFAGSYADYLAGAGGGSLDPGDLSAQGVDTVNNHVWAVLDHASLFTKFIIGQFFFTADFNEDGTVGGLDLVQWQGDLGANGDSDADMDGDSDGFDFLVWQRGSALSAAASQTAIPEPAAGGLLWLAGMFWWGCRRRG